MFAWLSANLINIVLVTVIVLIVALLIRGMIRDKKAGRSSCGGSCASCGACLCHLLKRFKNGEEFPHEIGLFLSYPPEDVKGFLEDRDSCKAVCLWKVYGDEEKARHICARYRKCTECYCRLWQQGRRLEQLAVAS